MNPATEPGAADGVAGQGGPGAASDRTRVAAYAVCRDDAGRVLLCHIAPSVGVGDLWTLPGGGLEFGEAPAAGVLRELAEETGHAGEITALLDVGDRVFDDPDGSRLHAIRIVYTVRIVGGELRDESDGSTDTCRWFARDELTRVRIGELARRAIDLDDAGR